MYQEHNATYYTAHADNYNKAEYFRSDEANILKRFCPPPGKLLIAGVGGGRTAAPLQNQYEITGIDIIPAMIEHAKKNKGTYLVMDMSRTTFPDNTFDYVFSPFN